MYRKCDLCKTCLSHAKKTHANKWIALGLMVNSVVSQAYLETKQDENQTREPTSIRRSHSAENSASEGLGDGTL